MPLRLLRCYADMLPRLQAEEALQQATIAGLPHMEREDRQAILDSWQRQAEGLTFVRPKMSREQFKSKMAAMGVPLKD